ncbi:type I-D CRISPR-associated helicase Cas3' [Nostoc sp. 'Peltigera membranacea cyanobiont' N6]|uniref:type I-D CRISPR-associated helicase Cas3' n=1 Tax=Nostoc sp. 'Peltigera membranacea cyanobiont' N6 TaxID=1261031 RepID=UPI000CF34026|nr:type I-D CRISPR-associated helicase Cas3' [Nostoc sp. 'Peltigera membranacea cyanobiont' N6]AVH65398.1 CRISPR-associated helicase Cas3 [Nostoc sp. 'Peltigera membranacea cyanobiont' N6]
MSENYRITLKPVYSQTVPTPDGVKLPKDWLLSWHQAATLEALRDPNIDVVFNTAMTGDGKSLAGYLDILQRHSPVLGLYPTNELARDQEKQIRGYIDKFQPEHKPRVNRLSGQELEIYAEEENLKKGAALETRTAQSDILLTNPDIFHYLHYGAYLFSKDNPDKLWNRIDKRFNLIIFDEFHVFQAPQIVSVINTMLLIRHTNRRKKFLFLSATPNPQLIERLKLADFRCHEINPLEENKYQFPDNLPEPEYLKTQSWRKVVGEISLQFVSLEPTSKASETWLKDNVALILEHLQKHPGSKGAIILNSIAAVKRLKDFFTSFLQPYNLTVEENTGLSGKKTKEESLNADLVLGTSTIDVGVDFKINFLFFESADAGNFIQRLGRLGRHDGYERDGQQINFTNFTAYALVPEFLVKRLFEKDEKDETPLLKSGEVYERPFFHDQIRDKYRKINDFTGYYFKWGVVQSMRLVRQLGHPNIKQQYAAGSQEALKKDCEIVFSTDKRKVNLKAAFIRSKEWEEKWHELSGTDKGNPILEEAVSFRGKSPLLCGIYDTTEKNEADKFKTYDLPGILSNLEIEPMKGTEFERLRQATAECTDTTIPKGRFKNCLGFMKLLRYREERLDWKFTYPGDLKPFADNWDVQVLLGIQVWQPANYWISEINKQLKKQALVSYLLPFPLERVRQQGRLPMHFQIYPISDQYSVLDNTPPYCIAFGQSALLLDTLTHWFKSKGDEIWITPCLDP